MGYLKKALFLLVAIVLFVVVLLAAADNSNEVALQFLDWQTWVWPISWWMLLAFIAGVAFGTVLNLVSNTRLRLDVRKANKSAAGHARALDQTKAHIGAES